MLVFRTRRPTGPRATERDEREEEEGEETRTAHARDEARREEARRRLEASTVDRGARATGQAAAIARGRTRTRAV